MIKLIHIRVRLQLKKDLNTFWVAADTFMYDCLYEDLLNNKNVRRKTVSLFELICLQNGHQQ